jgi:hypothetical protein
MASVIRLRRGTSSQWAASTIVMAVAELGLDTTLNKLKAGNGIHTWNNLPYLNALPSEIAELSQDALNTALVAGLHTSKTYDDEANTITIASTLTDVDNTSDINKPVSTATQTQLNLKAPLASPTFTGTVTLPDKTVSSSSINWTVYSSEADLPPAESNHGMFAHVHATGSAYYAHAGFWIKLVVEESPAFTGIPTAPTAISSTNTTQIATTQFVKTAVADLVNSAPAALDTLKELSDALNSDPNYATTISSALSLKAPIDAPTFTGLVSGITKAMVGLDLVDNTPDATKPISSAVGAAINTINESLNTKSNNLISSSVVTSSPYTLTAADLYTRVECHSTSAITIIVPKDLSVNLPVGTAVELLQSNTGKITVQGEDVTVALYGPDNQFRSRVQWSSIFLEKRGADSWLVTGDTEA